MVDYPHLNPEARQLMSLPKQARLNRVFDEQWFDNSTADRAFEILDQLVSRPRKARMRSLLIIGDSGLGKSWLLKRYKEVKQAEAQDAQNKDRAATVPVIIATMPANPREGAFWSAVLEKLCISFRPGDKVEIKQRQAMNALRSLGTRALVIDEFQHILNASPREQRGLLALTKTLCDGLEMPIIAVGDDRAVRALYTDPQLTTRFQQFRVERWKLDQEFRVLLASIEQALPLAQTSDLPGAELARRIHFLSDGVMTVLLELLRTAAALAIKSGAERITAQLIEDAWEIVGFKKQEGAGLYP